MDLRQLSALVAIADHGSFSGAAAALHTVQSNVSTHIKRLERELGVQLVDRQSGELTEEGQAVAERSRRIQAELDACVADVAALRQEVVGSVRLGMIGTTARWLVPVLLDHLAVAHPRVRLVTTEGTSAALTPLLLNGTLDGAVINLPLATPEILTRPLFDEDLVLVLAENHPLSSKASLAIEDLDGLTLLLPAAHTAFREELDEAVRVAGISFNVKAEIDGLRLLASLALRGYGPAILPATGVSDLPAGYRTVGVRGLPLRHVGLAVRRRGRPSAPTRALLRLLDDIVTTDVAAQPHLHPPGHAGD
jgi:DNA-binding transcriptional LysR family regulator